MAHRKLRTNRLSCIVEIPSSPLPQLPPPPKKGGKAPDRCRRPSPDGAVIDSPVKNDSVPVCPGIPGGRARGRRAVCVQFIMARLR